MKSIQTLTTIALIATTSTAFAHGDNKHEKAEYDPVQNEFGAYDPDLKPGKTIDMTMSDAMRFAPDAIKIKQGDVLRIKVANTGQLQHEFVLGTQASLDEHAELMKKFPNMEHEEPYMAHVDPGENGEIVWQFTQKGTFGFGCLIPGHYDAGMKGVVVVE